MLAFSDIIDFLLRILGDDEARAEFEQDPQGTLERAGLEGVTGQDIRDARLQLADSGAVHATDDGYGSSYPDGDDPVREVGYTTQHYAAEKDVHHHDDAGHADLSPADRTVVTIDDRDTLFFQSISDNDVAVTDNSVTISDSFNLDNSDDDLVAIQDNSSNDVTVNADNSFNEDNDLVAIQDNDVNGGDESIVVNPDDVAAAPQPVEDTALPVDLGDPVEPEPEPTPDTDAEAPADLAAVSGPAEIDEEPAPADVGDTPADGGDDLAADDPGALVG